MGLLDSVLGALGGQQAEGGVQNALVNGVLGLIEREGGLVQNIKDKGFGEVVSSWVSTGENLPINSEQVQQALGREEIQELAAKAGITPESAKTNDLLLPQIKSGLHVLHGRPYVGPMQQKPA